MIKPWTEFRLWFHRGLALFLLLTGALSAPATGLQKQKSQHGDKDQDTIKLSADLVVVDVTATDADGHYVHGLKPEDFVLSEDGSPQEVSVLAAEESPFAAAILIDTSGSMEFKFGMVRGAAASFLEHIRDDDQVAVYGFNNKIRQYQDFSNSKEISDYIWDAKAEDSTKLYDCMDTAIDALAKRPERRRAILVITDGCDNTSGATADSVTKKALKQGVTIYSIDLIDDDFLRGSGSAAETLRRGRMDMSEFARQTGGRYVHSPQGDTLEDNFDGIVDELRNQYTLSYYSTNSRKDGRWRSISVSIRRPGIATRARRGYYAAKN